MRSDDKLKNDFKLILDAVGYEISVNDYEKLDIPNKPARKTLAKRFGDISWVELKSMVCPEFIGREMVGFRNVSKKRSNNIR